MSPTSLARIRSLPLGLLTAISFAFLVSALYIGTVDLNSDLLVPEFIFRDLFVSHTPMDGWNFSASFFIFPDWIFYFLARSLTDNLRLVLIGYASLQLLAIYGVFKILNPLRGTALFLFWLLSFVAFFPSEWFVLLLPVHHGGVLITGLLFSLIFLRTERLSKLDFAILAVIGSLSLASDHFFGLQTLLPLGVCSIAELWKKRIDRNEFFKRSLLAIVTILAAIACERFLNGLFHSSPIPSLSRTLDSYRTELGSFFLTFLVYDLKSF